MRSSDDLKRRRPKTLRRPEDDIPSTSGPTVKNHRLGMHDPSEEPEENTIKTRRSIKLGRHFPPKCCLCKEEKRPEEVDVKKCAGCLGFYHIKKCLRYRGNFAENILNKDGWKCPRCTRCAACNKLVDDPENVECSVCCGAWHGLCAPKRYETEREFDADWVCSNCCAGRTNRRPRPAGPRRYVYVPVEKMKMARKGHVVFADDIRPLTELLNQRDFIWETLSAQGGLIEAKADASLFSYRCHLRKKAPRKMLPFRIDYLDALKTVGGAAAAAETGEQEKIDESGNAADTEDTEDEEGEEAEEAEEDSGEPGPSEPRKAEKKAPKESNISPETAARINVKKIKDFMTKFDRNIYCQSKREAYGPPRKSAPAPCEEQWLHMATGKACLALYKSAYKEPLASAPDLYACKFCLHTVDNKPDYIVHWDLCTARYPPGNEIYRHEKLSFFEVDGAKQKKYCQNLCLLAKLFIASKTLYDEVQTFIFYVLCEHTSEGFLIVGYFSKEKNPAENNNLSCLLVMPTAQKKGYGRLLIDMSYELSRIEHRIGHPEHPLSDLGILAYRGYWRSSILCYLRSLRNTETISLKDMCLETRITQVDLVNQMMLDNLIVLKNGEYCVKIGKRALKYPLSFCRRRTVDRSKIIWTPEPTGEVLDPKKINTYV